MDNVGVSEAKPDNPYVIHSGDEIFFAGDSMMQGVAPHIQQYLQKITTSNPSILPNKVQVWLIQAYLIGQNHQRDTVHQCQYQNFGCIFGA